MEEQAADQLARPLTIVLLVLAIAAFVVPQPPAVGRRRRELAADSED